MNRRRLGTALLFTLVLGSICSLNAQTIGVNNGWNNTIITSIGQDGSDYYAQSFRANLTEITKIGVVIQELSPEGEIILSIAADNGSGIPNYAAPLYQGTIKNPTTTAGWYYEEGLHIPITPGEKYYVLLDGYNNAGATGRSGIGRSSTQPISGEGLIWSNNGGVGTWDADSTYTIAIYVEGVAPAAIPTMNEWGIIFFMISLTLVAFYFLKRFRTA